MSRIRFLACCACLVGICQFAVDLLDCRLARAVTGPAERSAVLQEAQGHLLAARLGTDALCGGERCLCGSERALCGGERALPAVSAQSQSVADPEGDDSDEGAAPEFIALLSEGNDVVAKARQGFPVKHLTPAGRPASSQAVFLAPALRAGLPTDMLAASAGTLRSLGVCLQI